MSRSLSYSFILHLFFLLAVCILLHRQTVQNFENKTVLIELEPAPISERTKRIVQTLKTQKLDQAPNDAFLGAQNQKMDRETVSVNQKVNSGGKKAAQKNQGHELQKLGLPLLPNQLKVKNTLESIERLGEEWNRQETPQDYIKGIKESDRTALSTKEYVFYGYFQRIRQRLDLAWGGALREKLLKLYRSGRQLSSDMDHITRLVVVLNQNGEVVRVQVVEESGVHDLDDAAIKAFNQAGPFPNPPRGLVDKNGLIQIRWDFILKT